MPTIKYIPKADSQKKFMTEEGELIVGDLAKAIEKAGPGGIITVHTLGALGQDLQEAYNNVEWLARAEVGLQIYHLSYNVVALSDAPANTITSDKMQEFEAALESALGLQTMIELGADGRAKLNESTYDWIIRLHRNGWTQEEIAEELGVSRATVNRHWRAIKKGKWL